MEEYWPFIEGVVFTELLGPWPLTLLPSLLPVLVRQAFLYHPSPKVAGKVATDWNLEPKLGFPTLKLSQVFLSQ